MSAGRKFRCSVIFGPRGAAQSSGTRIDPHFSCGCFGHVLHGNAAVTACVFPDWRDGSAPAPADSTNAIAPMTNMYVFMTVLSAAEAPASPRRAIGRLEHPIDRCPGLLGAGVLADVDEENDLATSVLAAVRIGQVPRDRPGVAEEAPAAQRLLEQPEPVAPALRPRRECIRQLHCAQEVRSEQAAPEERAVEPRQIIRGGDDRAGRPAVRRTEHAHVGEWAL